MTDPQLRSLLLQRLSEEEMARVEESILLEDGVAERLCDAEFDLLDDYAASRLDATDARDVERYLLSSEQGRQSLRMARALHAQGSISPSPVRREPPPREAPAVPRRRRKAVWSGAALLAACLAVVAYIPQWQAKPIISLMADVTRGPPLPPFSLPAGARQIRLQAEVLDADPGTRFSLLIEDPAGRRLFTVPALEMHSAGRYRFVETVVPVEALGPGERTISLEVSNVAAAIQPERSWRVNIVIH